MNASGQLHEKRCCSCESCSTLGVVSSSLSFIHTCFHKRRKKSVCGLGCTFCYWDRWKFCTPNALMFTENKQYYTFLPCLCTALYQILALLQHWRVSAQLTWDWRHGLESASFALQNMKKLEQRNKIFYILFQFLYFYFLKTAFEEDLILVLQCGMLLESHGNEVNEL